MSLCKIIRSPNRRKVLSYINRHPEGLTTAEIKAKFPGITNLFTLLQPAREEGLCLYDGRTYTVTVSDPDILDIDDSIAWALASETGMIILSEIIDRERSITELIDIVKGRRDRSEAQTRATIREMRLRGVVRLKRKEKTAYIQLNSKYREIVRKMVSREEESHGL